MYPELQKRAQREVDSVTDGKRLPLMNDRESLSFVNAFLKELARWYTVVPLGTPSFCQHSAIPSYITYIGLAHVSAEDSEYDGYFIPKGAIVMTNTWYAFTYSLISHPSHTQSDRSILHDPEVYENPMQFNPDRFLKNGRLDPSVPDPASIGAFGYGRRVCPGRALSGETLFLMAANILAAFDVLPPKDEKTGLPVQLKLDTLNAVIASPVPFKCNIRLRSQAHESLL